MSFSFEKMEHSMGEVHEFVENNDAMLFSSDESTRSSPVVMLDDNVPTSNLHCDIGRMSYSGEPCADSMNQHHHHHESVFRRAYTSVKSYLYGTKIEQRERHIHINGMRRVRRSFTDHSDPQYRPPVFTTNSIRTSKYTVLNFIPKNLWEQFRRLANFYFIIGIIMQSFPQINAYSSKIAAVPLFVIFIITAAKYAIEDYKRHQADNALNAAKCLVLRGGQFVILKWSDICVGDICKLMNNDSIPADLILISTSEEDSICFLETKNLDGETNLKIKQGPILASAVSDDDDLIQFSAVVHSEEPRTSMFSYHGNLYLESSCMLDPHCNGSVPEGCSESMHIEMNGMLLRGCVLRNTDYVYGIVVYTGHDTKIMLNGGDMPSKTTRIDRKLNPLLIVNISMLIILSLLNAILHTDWITNKSSSSIGALEGVGRVTPIYSGFISFWSSLIIYGTVIPISLYITVECAKTFQAYFIHSDLNMYDEDTNTPCIPHAWNLSDDLGQIKYIFSDKTGTLTRNIMEFRMCSINGHCYGSLDPPSEEDIKELAYTYDERFGHNPYRSPSPSFFDQNLVPFLGKCEAEEKFTADISPSLEFFTLLALCHSVLIDKSIRKRKSITPPTSPSRILSKLSSFTGRSSAKNSVCEFNTSTSSLDDEVSERPTWDSQYNAQSPDESALVQAAKDIGFVFVERIKNSIVTNILGHTRMYNLLNVLEFNSERKRMSVIVQAEDGRIILYCKGADSVIYERLASSTKEESINNVTLQHLENFASMGLRTLCLAMRIIPKEEYEEWAIKFADASMDMQNREKLCDDLADTIEQGLILLGATAIEDKLQEGVPETINLLADGGLRLWMLTGDKQETAINIGFSCNLLNEDFDILNLSSDSSAQVSKMVHDAVSHYRIRTPQVEVNKKYYTAMQRYERWKVKISNFVREAFKLLVIKFRGNQDVAVEDDERIDLGRGKKVAIVIDGPSLQTALSENIRNSFLHLAVHCDVVICCRVAPLQKAEVVDLVKMGKKEMTLAIGDGANDVSMIQRADIGVGISGEEGQQAAMSSDYSIAQFRFLAPLLLVHGRWSYLRVSNMIPVFFAKNFTMAFTLFCFQFTCGFSGQLVYHWTVALFYNLFFTTLPVFILGLLDYDIDAEHCMAYPQLYRSGSSGRLFTKQRCFLFFLEGIYQGLIIFVIVFFSFNVSIDKGGHMPHLWDLGVVFSSCIIVNANMTVCLMTMRWTWVTHFVNWGSILAWFVFLIIFTSLPTSVGNYQIYYFAGNYMSLPIFWLINVITIPIALGPRFVSSYIYRIFDPAPADIVRERQILKMKIPTPFLEHGDGRKFEKYSENSLEMPTPPMPVVPPSTSRHDYLFEESLTETPSDLKEDRARLSVEPPTNASIGSPQPVRLSHRREKSLIYTPTTCDPRRMSGFSFSQEPGLRTVLLGGRRKLQALSLKVRSKSNDALNKLKNLQPALSGGDNSEAPDDSSRKSCNSDKSEASNRWRFFGVNKRPSSSVSSPFPEKELDDVRRSNESDSQGSVSPAT